jgi:catechol 2,3-dioxygenase-like lactoylglutathione lyase family enzyme
MTTPPAPLAAVSHLALPSFDAAATHRFCTEVLGLPLADAASGRSPEWGDRAFLHTAYALPSGARLTYFDVESMTRPPDDGLPRDVRHVASEADVLAWRARIERFGVAVVTEQHGPHTSIYFDDPNGTRLEITADPQYVDPARAQRAAGLVAAWIAGRR